jgi:hypothetical protein
MNQQTKPEDNQPSSVGTQIASSDLVPPMVMLATLNAFVRQVSEHADVPQELREAARDLHRKGRSSLMNSELTPAAHWRAAGTPDPHGKHYDCERAKLNMGYLSDDELANEAFLHYDARPSMAELLAGTARMPIAYMTGVKDRIRWLSRRLVEAEEKLRQAQAPSQGQASGE